MIEPWQGLLSSHIISTQTMYQSYGSMLELLGCQLAADIRNHDHRDPPRMVYFHGALRSGFQYADLLVKFTELEFVLVGGTGSQASRFDLFRNGDTFIAVEDRSTETTIVYVLSRNEQFIEKIRDITYVFLDKEVRAACNMLVTNGNSTRIEPIGKVDQPLNRENYTPEVLAHYDHVVANLNSGQPKGRLTIINGPPGTGKTTLISGLMYESQAAEFVLVSPDMVSSLTKPNFVSTLMGRGRPTTLVLEDGDECVATRKGDNISSIQSILNFADGIVGKLLDIRIVVTTNLKKEEFDPAVIRRGRLCRFIEVGSLSAEHANRVYQRLRKTSDSPFVTNCTLGDIYALANEDEAGEEVKKARKIGFG